MLKQTETLAITLQLGARLFNLRLLRFRLAMHIAGQKIGLHIIRFVALDQRCATDVQHDNLEQLLRRRVPPSGEMEAMGQFADLLESLSVKEISVMSGYHSRASCRRRAP